MTEANSGGAGWAVRRRTGAGMVECSAAPDRYPRYRRSPLSTSASAPIGRRHLPLALAEVDDPSAMAMPPNRDPTTRSRRSPSKIGTATAAAGARVLPGLRRAAHADAVAVPPDRGRARAEVDPAVADRLRGLCVPAGRRCAARFRPRSQQYHDCCRRRRSPISSRPGGECVIGVVVDDVVGAGHREEAEDDLRQLGGQRRLSRTAVDFASAALSILPPPSSRRSSRSVLSSHQRPAGWRLCAP